MEQIPNLSNQYGNLFQGYAVGPQQGLATSSQPALNQPSFWQRAGNFAMGVLNGSNPWSGLITGAASIAGNLLNRGYEAKQAKIQRDWNEAMLDKQNQFNIDMWNMTNEYNTPAAQKQRLLEAGMNPLNYGLDGNAAGGIQSANALGYDRASAPAINPIQAGLDQIIQQKQLDLIDANISKTKSETDSTTLDNEFKSKTMNARVEGEELANSLTKGQIAKIDDERKQIAENIKKTIAETENEVLKGFLIQAQENLAKVQAKEIVELLPYHKYLMQAQTDNQRAQASLAFLNAAVQKGLIEAGYVEKQIDEIEAKIRQTNAAADNNEAIAFLNQYKANLRNGTVLSENTGNWFYDRVNTFMNPILGAITMLGDLITGPITGIIK